MLCKTVSKYVLRRLIDTSQVSLISNTFPELCGLEPLSFCNVRKSITNCFMNIRMYDNIIIILACS